MQKDRDKDKDKDKDKHRHATQKTMTSAHPQKKKLLLQAFICFSIRTVLMVPVQQMSAIENDTGDAWKLHF